MYSESIQTHEAQIGGVLQWQLSFWKFLEEEAEYQNVGEVKGSEYFLNALQIHHRYRKHITGKKGILDHGFGCDGFGCFYIFLVFWSVLVSLTPRVRTGERYG